MEARDDFFSSLRLDFRRNGGESFLYQYLKQEKEDRVESGLGRGEKRKDAYVLLKLEFEAIRGEADAAGKADYLCEALKELLRNEELRPAPSLQELFDALGSELGGPEVFRGMKPRQRRKKLLELLKQQRPNVPLALVRQVHEGMLHCCLLHAGNTLLEDAERTNNPRKDRMLELYFSWRDRVGTEEPFSAQAAAVPGLPDTAELAQLDQFCGEVNKAEGSAYDRLILPVYIHPATGAALCLLGRERIGEALPSGVAKRMRDEQMEHCLWACFYVTGLEFKADEINRVYQEDVRVSWSSFNEDLSDMLFPTKLQEALDWYRWDILGEGNAAAFFRDENGAPPKDFDCPARFRQYFETQHMVCG